MLPHWSRQVASRFNEFIAQTGPLTTTGPLLAGLPRQARMTHLTLGHKGLWRLAVCHTRKSKLAD